MHGACVCTGEEERGRRVELEEKGEASRSFSLIGSVKWFKA